LPEEVTVSITEDGLLIQNSGGSSMGNNRYTIFDDIDEMWIFLIKNTICLKGKKNCKNNITLNNY
jgi:hypothetical protein